MNHTFEYLDLIREPGSPQHARSYSLQSLGLLECQASGEEWMCTVMSQAGEVDLFCGLI